MFVEREIREELNALSKEVFGVSSKWHSILEHGIRTLVTEEIEETVPGEDGKPDEVKKVQMPKLKNGSRQFYTKRYTLEEVTQMLHDMKKHRDEMIAKFKAAQEQKELEKKVNDEAQGRVVVG